MKELGGFRFRIFKSALKYLIQRGTKFSASRSKTKTASTFSRSIFVQRGLNVDNDFLWVTSDRVFIVICGRLFFLGSEIGPACCLQGLDRRPRSYFCENFIGITFCLNL